VALGCGESVCGGIVELEHEVTTVLPSTAAATRTEAEPASGAPGKHKRSSHVVSVLRVLGRARYHLAPHASTILQVRLDALGSVLLRAASRHELVVAVVAVSQGSERSLGNLRLRLRQPR